MQITYKICKVKDVYDKVLKNVTCKLRKVLSKSVKMSKEVGKVLKSVQISPCRNQKIDPQCKSTCWLRHSVSRSHKRFQNRAEYQ